MLRRVTSFEGLEIGAVSVKWARLAEPGEVRTEVRAHNGQPRRVIEQLFAEAGAGAEKCRMAITGQAARSLMNAPYFSTTECLERALAFHGKQPDILLALGGETFSVYPMKQGVIKNVVATSKCAAGTGEFIVQQLQRMGMRLEQGLQACAGGKHVPLATRCSVHCKSDATHKLNKGECSRGDIARSLIDDLAQRVADMVRSARWPTRLMVISGGVAANQPFARALRQLFPDSDIEVVDNGTCLEALGAALFAAEMDGQAGSNAILDAGQRNALLRQPSLELETLPPLGEAAGLLDYRADSGGSEPEVVEGNGYILGLDAGSTTTKAVLLDVQSGTVGASCYLRTLGNPVQAARNCLIRLMEQTGRRSIRILQAATTGSGREMVSVYLGNCPSFNEILAHARAASEEVRKVGTVFEIGGQDSKYISFANGIPVGYAMNEGCSAGTGSFLEESASVDMGVTTTQISRLAESSRHPIAFGERCAAFINTDLRNALQQGALPQDVIAGLVYSIADNYISRIVGPRPIRDDLLFLGGVALNRSVALAIAARTGRRVVVPPHPELMGSVGAALMARDRMRDGRIDRTDLDLERLAGGEMTVRGSFRCRTCENVCEVQKIEIRSKIYPFGGLCSRYENQRRKGQEGKQGRDLLAVRNRMMFEDFAPRPVADPRGTIGLPLALTTYQLFPFYSRLINALGYEVTVSEGFREGLKKTVTAICYPCQVAHGAVDDLLAKKVDFILLPRLLELQSPPGNLHGYTCPSTAIIPDVIRAAFEESADRVLSPHIGLTEELRDTSIKEIERLAPILKLSSEQARQAALQALSHQERFEEFYRERGRRELEQIRGEPSVVLAGRPYTVYAPNINLALPRKITSRGYHAVPADMLPLIDESVRPRDVWRFTQQVNNAVEHVRRDPDLHICLVSCFSCGPDSVMYHLFRERLAGRPFCYLEIDSHTAHAGFDTRVGAFLDILEEQGQKPEETGRADGSSVKKGEAVTRTARLSDDQDCIIDSNGGAVAYDDPRVVHVLTDVMNPYTARLVQAVYDRRGFKCRTVGRPNARIMQLGRTVCSGRECVPMMATAGAVVDDIRRHRAQGEVTLYLSLDQEGPCQNGAWPPVWENFLGRLGATDAIGGLNRSARNKQLGFAGAQIQEINRCVLVGDLLEEAHNALYCTARDREEALRVFGRALDELVEAVRSGVVEMETALAGWADTMASVPLAVPVERTARVLIMGGLNLVFVHYPVSNYFLDQGIAVKVVDVAEGARWIESEGFVRTGLKHGITDPAGQISFKPPKGNRKEALRVRSSRYGVNVIDAHLKKLRSVMEPSGLMFDDHIDFTDILQAGHGRVSNNGFGETSITTGRFICSEAAGVYDGLVNLGCFNCQPAMNSQGIIRPLANRSDMPYVALDCEGPWISANQTRLLEALAVQAHRARQGKNARAYRS